MKKLLYLSFLVFLCIPLLVGCGKKDRYDPTKGKKLISEIESLKASGPEQRARALPDLAIQQAELLRDLQGAQETMLSAQSACSSIEDASERVAACSSVAKGYAKLGDKTRAMAMLKQAEAAIATLPESVAAEDRINNLLNLVDVYVELELLDSADSSFQAAIEEADKSASAEGGTFSAKCTVYQKIVDKYASLKNTEGIDLVAPKLDLVIESAETAFDQCRTNFNVGKAYVIAESKEGAQKYYQKIEELVTQVDSKAQQAIVKCDLAEIAFGNGDASGAKKLVAEAEKLYTKDTDSTTREQASTRISEVSKTIGIN